MTPTSKLLAVSIAVVAAGLVLWNLQASTEAVPLGVTAMAAATDRPVEEGAATRGSAVAREEVRAELVPAPAAAAELGHAFAYSLLCRVVDMDGLPVAGASVSFAPRGCAMNQVPSSTSARGDVLLQWRGKVPAMVITVGTGRSVVEVNVRAGVEQRLSLLAAPRTSKPTRVKDVEAYLAARAPAVPGCERTAKARSKDCRSCHADVDSRPLYTLLQVRDGLHPETRFGDELLPVASSADLENQKRAYARSEVEAEHAVEAELGLIGFRVSNQRRAEVEVFVGSSLAQRDFGTITGRVLGEDGKPVSGTNVTWSLEPDLPLGRTSTGDDGTFELTKVTPGIVELRAGGGRRGLARVPVHVSARDNVIADACLQRGAIVRGRVCGANNKSLEGALVEYTAHDESWADGALVASDGTFELCNLPLGAGRLLLWTDSELPVAMKASVRAAGDEVWFDLRALREGGARLRLRLLLPEGLDHAAAEVRVWQLSSGCGAAMQKAKDGAFELGDLCAGSYRVEVGGDCFGWVDFGELWIDGSGVVDLGSVRLPTPGTLRLTNMVAGSPFELYLRRPDTDVRAEFAVGDRTELKLPAGRWLAMWKNRSTLRRQEFDIAAGAQTSLDLANAGR